MLAGLPKENKLHICRHLIAQEQFTPEQLSIPAAWDIVAVCIAIQRYPIQLSLLKIVILHLLSRQPYTRQDLQTITHANETRISHSLTELKEQNFITKQQQRQHAPYTLTTSGLQLLHLFHLNYFKVLTALTNKK